MKSKFPLVYFALFLILFSTIVIVRADDTQELLDKEKQYQQIIDSLKSKSNTLQNEMDYLNTQISLTKLKIDDTEKNLQQKNMLLSDLTNYIEALSQRITKLDSSMSIQNEGLKKRIIERYKSSSDLSVVNLLNSGSTSKLLTKLQYLQALEEQDRRIMSYMKDTKADYSVQQKLIEKKKAEVELIKKDIEKQKAQLLTFQTSLNKQNQEKQSLLEATQNDERKYQNLLAGIQAELDAQNLAVGIQGRDGSFVKKGTIIGYLGNTGCSTAPHLHFGMVSGSRSVDPLPYLKSGDFIWPLASYKVTQWFGDNYSFYMRRFGIPGHNAIDMVDSGSWIGSPIRAAKDGVLHYATDSRVYCPDINNSIGKGAIIDHGNGIKTIYWHMQ
jgi:peptidoglycan hydrolase CwlO-like protein